MKHLLTCIASLFLLTPLAAQEAPADYVNPFIGTTNFGTCNPGAICPNGMMSVVPFNVMGSPDNTYDKDARWWSTPYEYTNSFFVHPTIPTTRMRAGGLPPTNTLTVSSPVFRTST